MNSNDNLLAMLEVLKLHGVNYTEQFYKDICKLVKTDVNKFIKDFSRDFSRMSYKKHNRYEELSLNSDQKKRIDGKSLYRYEYRNSSNLRCIYIIEDEYNNITLLKAFNEDKGKIKGKGSYNFNIEQAIKIYISNL